MTEFSIFFHQNQLLKIRKFQDELCNFLIQNGILCAPLSPVMIQTENLSEKSKITKISLNPKEDFFKPEYQKGEILSLKSQIEIEENMAEGRTALLQILRNSKSGSKEINPTRNLFQEISSLKISPFKICKIEIEPTEKSLKWKILSEKWIKPFSMSKSQF